MDTKLIEQVFQIDFVMFFTCLIVLASALVAIVKLIEQVSIIIKKPVSWVKKKNKDHETIMTLIQTVSDLKEKHDDSVSQSILHDKMIKDDLDAFMSDIRLSINETQEQMKQFADNRIHDRSQSLEIQKELTDGITSLSIGAEDRTRQIQILTDANKEILADRINQKYKHYVNELKGIPSDEVDEFINLHAAYKALGGNHHGDAKYNYVMTNLPVIPVEVNLIYDEDK